MTLSSWQTALLTLAVLNIPGTAIAEETSRPNIVFVLVDDQRHDTLGCAGHPVIKTPNIDQLAAQGVRFDNAYVNTAICMASRATIFTGLTETSHGYTGGGPPAVPVQVMDIDSSFPVLLRAEGYRTGFYGKQHVSFAETEGAAMNRMFNDHLKLNGGPHFVKQADGSKRHSAEVIGDRSVSFLRTQAKNQPFCLYLSFNIAHAVDNDHRPGIGHFPWPKAVDGLYEGIDPAPPKLADPKYFDSQPKFLRESMNRDRWYWRWDTPEKYRTNMRAYFRMLTGMDRVIGRVQAELMAQGLAENTVIIYTADNGFYMGERGFAGKWSHYEESLHVPLIVHDPRIPQDQRGRVVPSLVMNLDLPATMLDLAGLPVPEKYQGHSLTSFLRGKAPQSWRKDFYNEHHFNHARLPKWRGVHTERYTYAHYYEQDPVAEMLYDLKTDPDQLENLAAEPEHAALLNSLRQRTREFQKTYTRPKIEALRKKTGNTASQIKRGE